MATLNPQYPTSWWGIGHSAEIRVGEVVPVKLLERDLVLWRDSAGTLHCQSAICPHLGANIGYGGEVVDDSVKCPFHGYRYDCSGKLCFRAGEDSRAPERLALTTYRVEEHFGVVFVWNGKGEPDHAFPVREALPDGVGNETDTTAFHAAWYLPFPARHFSENVADANHLGAVHRSCDYGEAEFIEETPYSLKQKMLVQNSVKVMSTEFLREMIRIGQLLNPSIATEDGITFTTFGGGINLVEFESYDRGGKNGLGTKLLNFVGNTRAIVCWTPVTADSQWHSATFITPKLRLPAGERLVRRALNRVMSVRSWGPIVQDCAINYYREEPEAPVYGRLDRGVLRYRRFWDSRIEDRTLWVGDNCHSYGARAGTRWEDAEGRPAARPAANGNGSAAETKTGRA